MVATPKQAFLARSLEFIQKPRGISLITFSALLILVMFAKTPLLLFKATTAFTVGSIDLRR
jgi:hypothetical protein